MKLAYADPPYPGCARKFYRDDPRCAEVDHSLLLDYLSTFDGWALSTSSVSLQSVLALCPSGVRIAAWVKPFYTLKRSYTGPQACYSPGYAWEPVIFKPSRTSVNRSRDWHAANRSSLSSCAGAKPVSFCYWLFDLLGYQSGDSFEDLFPGSGVVSATWRVLSFGPEQLDLAS